jgi:hypothetical protein
MVPDGCQPIPGATGTSYVSTSSDMGKFLTAQIAGDGPLGFALAGAISAVAVGSPESAVLPTVSGSAPMGSTWTVNTGTWTGVPVPTLETSWMRCDQPMTQAFRGGILIGCAPIAGANSTAYVSTAADIGKYLFVLVTGINTLGVAVAGTTNSTPIAP